MADIIKLVQGDTRPALIVTLTDKNANDAPINITGATVTLKFKEEGAADLTSTLVGQPIDPANGVCKFEWAADSLDVAGTFVGELEVVFPDTQKQSAFDLLYFLVREKA